MADFASTLTEQREKKLKSNLDNLTAAYLSVEAYLEKQREKMKKAEDLLTEIETLGKEDPTSDEKVKSLYDKSQYLRG